MFKWIHVLGTWSPGWQFWKVVEPFKRWRLKEGIPCFAFRRDYYWSSGGEFSPVGCCGLLWNKAAPCTWPCSARGCILSASLPCYDAAKGAVTRGWTNKAAPFWTFSLLICELNTALFYISSSLQVFCYSYRKWTNTVDKYSCLKFMSMCTNKWVTGHRLRGKLKRECFHEQSQILVGSILSSHARS